MSTFTNEMMAKVIDLRYPNHPSTVNCQQTLQKTLQILLVYCLQICLMYPFPASNQAANNRSISQPSAQSNQPTWTRGSVKPSNRFSSILTISLLRRKPRKLQRYGCFIPNKAAVCTAKYCAT